MTTSEVLMVNATGHAIFNHSSHQLIVSSRVADGNHNLWLSSLVQTIVVNV